MTAWNVRISPKLTYAEEAVGALNGVAQSVSRPQMSTAKLRGALRTRILGRKAADKGLRNPAGHNQVCQRKDDNSKISRNRSPRGLRRQVARSICRALLISPSNIF